MASQRIRTAGWSTGVRRGATPPSVVDRRPRRISVPVRPATLTERRFHFFGAIWSGTSRMATLRLAVAGTIVFMPGPAVAGVESDDLGRGASTGALVRGAARFAFQVCYAGLAAILQLRRKEYWRASWCLLRRQFPDPVIEAGQRHAAGRVVEAGRQPGGQEGGVGDRPSPDAAVEVGLRRSHGDVEGRPARAC